MNLSQRRNTIVIIMALMLVFAYSCTKKTAYRFFSTQANTVDAAMKTAGDFYKAGHIGEEDKDRIVKAYNAYKISYDSAIDAYLEYERAPEEEKDELLEKISIAVKLMTDRITVLRDILMIFDIELEID